MKTWVRRLEPDPATRAVEIVERKGIGHPDTISDGVAEEFSRVLCRVYRVRFGRVLHHNVDKVLLWGGASRAEFGGGKLLEPMELFLSGRATAHFDGVEIPLEELAHEACASWLDRHLRFVAPPDQVVLHGLVRPSSPALVDLFDAHVRSGRRLANDTSIGVGYAPLSPLERAVLAIEGELNSPELKQRLPATGEDVKVMGVQTPGGVELTIACAIVDRFVSDLDDYRDVTAQIEATARRCAGELLPGPIAVAVNAADDPERGDVYLTVTGTSAESGDDGQTGRGNRANGLITPYRPMTMESVAGKNPITHVGKLYNVAARLLAEDVCARIDEVEAAEIRMVSRIGAPIEEPAIVDVRVAAGSPERVEPEVSALVREHLDGLDALAERLIEGSLPFDPAA